MRGAKSLLVLVAVLAGLGAYIYFVESKKPGEGEATATQKLFSVKGDDIAEIEVKADGGDRTTLKKVSGAWQITDPIATAADEAEVSGIVTNLTTVDATRTVEENPGDLAQFGLANPRIVIAFKTADGKQSRQLFIGDKTATLGELYAKLPNEKKVFLIPGSYESTFNRSTFDLRQKAVLAFDRDKVDRLELQRPDGRVALVREAGEWKMTEPVKAPADYATVEALVGQLQSSQMKTITATEAKDLKAYGLDKPDATASVGLGSSRATLLFGGKAEADAVYAKDESRPLIFTVESALLGDVKRPVDELRRKEIFAFRAFNATAIEITRGAETLAFERTKGSGKDAKETWRQTKPTTRDVDNAAVDTFLTKLANLRSLSFVDPRGKTKTGLQAPALSVWVKFDEGRKEEKVAFGREGKDVFAAPADQPGASSVDATQFDDAVKALDGIAGNGQQQQQQPPPPARK